MEERGEGLGFKNVILSHCTKLYTEDTLCSP